MGAHFTNRDLYENVRGAAGGVSRSLEEYLRALRQLVRDLRDRETLTPEMFAALLIQALDSPVPPFDHASRTADLSLAGTEVGFDVWERVIVSQIADLRDFAEGPAQYFPELGVDAPRGPHAGPRANGRRWYNHSIQDYLECALAGSLGGWDVADDVRKPLPSSTLRHHPEPQGVTELRPLTWHELTEFLVCGQEYE